MKKILRKGMAFMMALTMCVSLPPNVAYAEEVNSVCDVTDEAQNGWDGVTTVKSYVADNYKVVFALTNCWDGGYNANVEIVNTGESVIENWCVEFAMSQDIFNIWNAKIEEKENGHYVIKNAGWNQDIPVGESVSFGFGVQESFLDFPKSYELLGEEEKTEKDRYEIVYAVVNDWKEGFTGNVIITNHSDRSIEDWIVECEFENEISTIWNAEIMSHENNHYVLGNARYNQNIAPNSSITIGFNVERGSASNEMSNFVLSNIDTSKSFDILTVSEEGLIIGEEGFTLGADFSGFSGNLKRADEVEKFSVSVYDKNQVLIFNSEINPMENWTTEDIGLVYGYNRVVFEAVITEKSDTKELVIDCSTNMYFDNLEIDLSDTDGDGLPNYLESYFGADLEVVDSDEDGLTDFQELYYFGYDVQIKDTDNDGVDDCDEDEDNDGLLNLKEFELGTDPLDNDSDNDRLLDGEELQLGTSPILEDTDGDGVNDYDEFRLEKLKAIYNAGTGMYTVEFSADAMEINYDKAVVPSVKLTADAEGVLSFDIQKVESNYLLNPSMTGYLGAAYEFTADGVMENAELTFTYDEALIGSEMIASSDFCPTIYYYNSEEGIIEEVEGQIWSGNQVSVTLSHFSTYILVNKADMERLWNETIEVEEGTELTICNHVVFVIDKSGSMPSNDPYYIRTSLIREFCSQLGNNDRIGLVGFSNSAIKYTDGLINDDEMIESAIAMFEGQRDTGGTYMNAAVENAVQMLQNADNNENAKQAIFILTDGVTSDNLTSAYLNTLKEKGITIYTVGLGSVSESYLKRIAESTEGKYFYAKTSSDLSEVFIDFEEELTDDDLNDDNLNDEITKLICQGKVTTATGTKVLCSGIEEEGWEEIYNEIMKSDDYDGDGLKNGEEIELFYIKNMCFVKFKTSPEIIDTDGDGYSDFEEIKEICTNPMIPNYIIDFTDYGYVSQYLNFESGKAYEDYINSNGFGIFMEFYIDVILCGGKANVNHRVRKELLDFFQNNLEENEENFNMMTVFDASNKFVNGICDLLPFVELGKERIEVTKLINMLQTDIILSRKQPFSKVYRKEMLHAIEEYRQGFKSYFSDVLKNGKETTLGKIGEKVGIALTILSAGGEIFTDASDYLAGVKMVECYKDILNDLQYCGNGNIEAAAQTVVVDMDDVFNKWLTIGSNSLVTIFQYAASTSESILITKFFGIPGLIIDLAGIAGGIVAGDALSTRLNNGISVDFALGMNGVTRNVLEKSQGIFSAKGEAIYVQYRDNNIAKTNRVWLCDIMAKAWCEEKYIAYLDDSRLFMDADFFLYKTSESRENAQKNLKKLNDLCDVYTLN